MIVIENILKNVVAKTEINGGGNICNELLKLITGKCLIVIDVIDRSEW